MSGFEARLLSELRAVAHQHADWSNAELEAAPRLHIAVMSEPFLSEVFAGRKTVESRFSLHRISPYQAAGPGDIVLVKAGPLVGCFTLSWVIYFDLVDYPIDALAEQYGPAMRADRAFWQRKAGTRYATLMGIADVRRLAPVRISKVDRRAWVTLTGLQAAGRG